MSRYTDPTETRLESLERPPRVHPPNPPTPAPTPASEATAEAINERVEKIRKGGAS